MNFDNSVIIIDKPPKMICHELTSWVKKLTGAKRSGHAGTLDPDVSGVLPVALGKATKLLRYMAGKDKIYIGIIKFKKIIKKDEIEKLFQKFTGEITQTPPKISAVRKIPRKRKVYYIKFIEQSKENPRFVLFETKVDAGTYIRTLCEDIGKLCNGARMEELRRIAVGDINEKQAFSMQQLIDALWLMKERKDDSMLRRMLQPPENFIDYPKVVVKDNALRSLLNGAQLMPAGIERYPDVKKGDLISLYSKDGRFIGIGLAQLIFPELAQSKKIAVKIERIHIEKK